MAYTTQSIFGQQSVPPEALDMHPDLDPNDAPELFGIYFIIVNILQEARKPKNSIYTGSATSKTGFASRISSHRQIAALGFHEIATRRLYGDPTVLRVHFEMPKLGATP
jgi:hypothetical protein